VSRGSALLDKARRSFDAAEELLQGGDSDFAASRAYFGYFYVAEALLDSKGLRFSRHGQVLAQYGRLFAKTEVLDRSFHGLYDTAFELRQLADYDDVTVIQSEAVMDLISGGRRFLAAAIGYLDALSEQPETEEAAEPEAT
jgi:uncharacterized protein (UPF0332 family)